MALFDFELAPLEDFVHPGTEDNKRLRWFDLTDGWLHLRVGDQVLFECTDEMLSRWGRPAYPLAALTRGVLERVAAAVAPLPVEIERLAADWEQLIGQHSAYSEDDSDAALDLHHAAWNWLVEREPRTLFLRARPTFYLIRIGDELRVHWDNRESLVDGRPVWTAERGMYALPVAQFLEESRTLVSRLMSAMQERIARLEAKQDSLQLEVDVNSLRQEHEVWREEFGSYFRDHVPKVAWSEAVAALRTIVAKKDGRREQR